jgi:RhoGAP domain
MKKRSQQGALTKHHWGGFNPLSPTVPPILRDTASFLLNQKSRALSSEGLFRVSGSNLRIRTLKEKYDKGRSIEMESLPFFSVLFVFSLSPPEDAGTELVPSRNVSFSAP